jgi:hypothetical protein
VNLIKGGKIMGRIFLRAALASLPVTLALGAFLVIEDRLEGQSNPLYRLPSIPETVMWLVVFYLGVTAATVFMTYMAIKTAKILKEHPPLKKE